MHDVSFSEDFEGLNHLPEVADCPLLWERPLLLHKFFQRASITELVHEVKIIDGFEHIDVLHNVGTVLNSR
jgi:hypothetical protein